MADVTTPGDPLDGPASVPQIALTSIEGRPVAIGNGRPLVVELWATWCPPCRGTLAELTTVTAKHADVAVVAIAVDSKLEDVRRMAAEVKATFPVVQGTAEIVNAFGAIAAVPKILVFGRDGRLARVIHGAPPDLHDTLEAAIAAVK